MSENEITKEVDEANVSTSFTLLREETVEVDAFEDKTHEKVADTLNQLIVAEKGGITIGLEGEWGCGKSTVISILEKKLQDSKQDALFVKFDAWAHEGDPLRRIFLESVIEAILNRFASDSSKKEIIEELENKKETISKRQKVSKTKTVRSVSLLGKFVAGAAFLVPFGASILSTIDYSTLTYKLTEVINWWFWLGFVCAMAPLIILLINLIFNPKNWAFFKKDDEEVTNQEISEDEERSSIEFEQLFDFIMNIYFSADEDSKIVFVLDNLDRVSAVDSLKIWSTMQTFLQKRSSPRSAKKWFNRLWIIVPYDLDGLKQVWKTRDEKVKNRSFFDKCFQVRLDVPKPVFTGWERFAQDMIKVASPNLNNDEQETVLQVLKLTRENLNDIPTPREIKVYINQVGVLHLHADSSIDISSIAYYAIQRYIKDKSVSDIRTELIEGNIPKEFEYYFLSKEIKSDLAGLIFGVNSQKGMQLLLEPEIADNLTMLKREPLHKLAEMYQLGFWSVFDNHISRFLNYNNIYKYTETVYKTFGTTENCKLFIRKIGNLLNNLESVEFPTEQNIEGIKACLKLISKSSSVSVYNKILISLDKKLKEGSYAESEIDVKILFQITSDAVFPIEKKMLSNFNYDKFQQWVMKCQEQKIDAWRWVGPNKNIIPELSSKIGAKVQIPEELNGCILYLLKFKIPDVNWLPVITNCNAHVKWNSGNYDASGHSFSVFNIIENLAFIDEKCFTIIETMLKAGAFYNLAQSKQSQQLIRVAMLMATVFKNDLQSAAIPVVGQSKAMVDAAKKLWATRNKINAQSIYDSYKNNNRLDVLWDILSDKSNVLLLDIFECVTKDVDSKIFETDNILDKMYLLSELIDSFSQDDNEDKNDKELLDRFIDATISQGDIESELINTEDIKIIEYAEVLYKILKKITNSKVVTSFIDSLKKLSKENWSEIFDNCSYVLDIAIELSTNRNTFRLSSEYSEAFTAFACNLPEKSDWWNDNWNKLHSLMKKDFQTLFGKDITKYLIDKKFSVTPDFLNLNKDYLDNGIILKRIEDVKDALLEGLRSPSIDIVSRIHEVLVHFKLTSNVDISNMRDVFEDKFRKLHSTLTDENHQKTLIAFASDLGIDITVPLKDADVIDDNNQSDLDKSEEHEDLPKEEASE